MFNPKNPLRIFHVEETSKRSFPRRFNVEYTWRVCREATNQHLLFCGFKESRLQFIQGSSNILGQENS